MPHAPKRVPIKPERPGRPRLTTSQRGYGAEHVRQRARLLEERPICEICCSDWSSDLHHKDRNPFNRNDSNALMVCEACHHNVLHGGT
jgi:hypothetical protein